ncbi:MAG: DUF354 domain-containing protein [Ignisphaera sp.]|uniref:DUF354 domain-containing protein n=1 Tax=Ignisphaera aggregans TaxID=334771 RepID=A0A7C4NNS3_9CREN
MAKTIWLDVLTPKQAMLLGTIATTLKSKGYNVTLTTRSYDYTQAVLKNLGVEFVSLGGYGNTLIDKLLEEINRMRSLVEVLGDKFDIAIAYPNPVAARISFGLNKPYIALTDSPHSEIVSRLSLPLARYVIFSKCIPISTIEPYIYKEKTKLVPYNGVDEVEWLKDIHPDMSYVRSIGLEPYSYVVARPPEVKASYYRYNDASTVFEAVLNRILDLNLKVLYLPRYIDDPLAQQLRTRKNVVIPSTSHGVIGYNVIYYALAVITGGGTLAREAALLGIPGISLFPEELYVDKCVQELGLPLTRCRSLETCLSTLVEYIREPDRFRCYAQNVLKTLEKPSDALLKLIEEANS